MAELTCGHDGTTAKKRTYSDAGNLCYDAEFRRKYGTHAIGSGTGAEPVEHEYHAEGFYLEDRNKALARSV